MKRKLLEYKSVKTLKSLLKNLQQKRNGVKKQITKKEKALKKINDDISRIESIVVRKNEFVENS